jgi:hypothetical protein
MQRFSDESHVPQRIKIKSTKAHHSIMFADLASATREDTLQLQEHADCRGDAKI